MSVDARANFDAITNALEKEGLLSEVQSASMRADAREMNVVWKAGAEKAFEKAGCRVGATTRLAQGYASALRKVPLREAMKRASTVWWLAIWFVATLLPTILGPVPTWAQTERDRSVRSPAAIFSKVESDLLDKTGVPLRLPSWIPDDGEKQHPLYAILQSASQTGYKIELAWTPDCSGGNNCHYGTVQGSISSIVENEGLKEAVSLEGGIKGYFIGFTCGAHCDDSAIGWSEGGYQYSISVKAEKKATLIKVANSAIVSRTRHGR